MVPHDPGKRQACRPGPRNSGPVRLPSALAAQWMGPAPHGLMFHRLCRRVPAKVLMVNVYYIPPRTPSQFDKLQEAST